MWSSSVEESIAVVGGNEERVTEEGGFELGHILRKGRGFQSGRIK